MIPYTSMPRPTNKLKTRPKSQAQSKARVEDDYLDTDSEVDEFAPPGRAGPSGSSDQSEDDEGVAEEDRSGEEGVGQWEPDDWENGDLGGSDVESESGSEGEESGDEAVSLGSSVNAGQG